MSEIKETVVHATQKILENPKVGYGTSGATIIAGLNANDIAVWLGICVSAAVLYNQVMIAYRDWKKNRSDKEGGS